MLKQIARLRVGLVLLLGILLFSSGALAMEVINRGDNRGDNRGYSRGDNGGERHYYRDGRWYKHDSRGNEISVDVLGIGVRVESLPPQHTTIVVGGASYYHDDRYYYRQAPNGGYTVVSAPVIVQPQPQGNYDKRGDRGGNSRNEGNRDQNR